MNLLKKVYCRIFQGCFYIAIPFMPYREPEILTGIYDLPKHFKEKNINSVLIVTDNFLSSTDNFLALTDTLAKEGISIGAYTNTRANPTVTNVEEALEIYHHLDCRAIIAYGGGSPMDCAKAVGARVAYPHKKLSKLKGLLKVLRRIPDLIAIPTTAGTGSEVTVTAVITDSEKKHKYTMNNFTLIPRYAILDPAVTYSLPPHLTATTGMDALTHAVEVYIGRSTTKKTRAYAKEAVRLIFENLYTAYTQPFNHHARKNMLTAAYKAGVAFTTSYVGYIHAVAHSLGGQYNIAHGLANSVLMPYVLEGYGSSAHKKLYELALSAGVCEGSDSYSEGARKFIGAIRELNEKMGIPQKLDGIQPCDIPLMAKHADKEANPLYPVPKLMDARELEKFYYMVMKNQEKEV